MVLASSMHEVIGNTLAPVPFKSQPLLAARLGYYRWRRDLFSSGFVIQNGDLILSEAPGWGIEPDPEWLQYNDYQVSYMGDRF